jgi:hypothetical protein
MRDYIPDSDDEFNTYAGTKFVPYAVANATALGLPPGDITSLQAKMTAWNDAFTAYENAKAAYAAALEAKDAARSDLEGDMRMAAGKVQANPAVTAAQKEGLGVTVRKTTRTATPVPSSVPSMQRIDTSTRSILRLFIVDAASPDSRAKPPGVQSCEIREQIGGTPPTSAESMPFLALETRMPYRADYESGDVGKTVYFALRWINTRGEPGPWSQVYTAVVPS